MSVTKKSDLHTDTPLWASSPRIAARTRTAPRRQSYDVVIIGGGISGALMADALANARRSVLVVDRRKPVGGSSLASTAMIQHEIDVPLTRLADAVGRVDAARIWARSMAAVDGLARRVKQANISCSFQRKATLLLSGDDMGWRALETEAELRAAHDFGAQFIKGAELKSSYGIDRTGAILTDCSASANPAQMTAGFLRQAARNGAELLCDTEVIDVESAEDEVRLTLDGGRWISAHHAIFCTGYEFLKPLERLDHQVVSTWAIATKPRTVRPDWLDRFLVWEASNPYLYLRSTPDGRIVAGGEDEAEETAHQDKAKLKRKAATIARKVSDVLAIDPIEVDYCWAGPFGTTPDGLPIIDEVPSLKNVFTVMGYGGNGITFSQIASEILKARIEGRTDPDAELFSMAARDKPPRAA